MRSKAWSEGRWLNPPAHSEIKDGSLYVTSEEGSDFWRETAYGFTHESGHALLYDFPKESSVEVTFKVNYDFQFDQAGLIIWSDKTQYIKAGVEFADGAPQLGAVVTNEKSDWSVAPVPNWMNNYVTIRASRSGDALTVRAKREGEWQLVRLAPLDPTRIWQVGPLVSSTNRGGLVVEFTKIEMGLPDSALH